MVEFYELSDSDQENVDPDMHNTFEGGAVNQVVSSNQVDSSIQVAQSNQINSSSSIKEYSETINIRCKKTTACTSSTETVNMEWSPIMFIDK